MICNKNKTKNIKQVQHTEYIFIPWVIQHIHDFILCACVITMHCIKYASHSKIFTKWTTHKWKPNILLNFYAHLIQFCARNYSQVNGHMFLCYNLWGHEKFIMSCLKTAQKMEYTDFNLFMVVCNERNFLSFTKDSPITCTIKMTLFVPSDNKIIIHNTFH